MPLTQRVIVQRPRERPSPGDQRTLVRRRWLIWLPFVAAFFIAAGYHVLPKPEAQFVRRIAWMGRGTWVKADTHVHTQFSDGVHSVAEVVRQAVDHGCDVLAVTDHADRTRNAATPEYAEAIQAARRTFPETVILAGLEWNVPPWGGDEHATVLVPDVPEEFDLLSEFKARFDDHGRAVHDPQRAERGLKWLHDQGQRTGTGPIMLYNHPGRQASWSLDAADRMAGWRAVSKVVVGFSGAPGHQNSDPLGSYDGMVTTIDRWDPAAARVGDAWDALLAEGHDVWAARAPSDFHSTTGDYWPGEFSETWLYVPERSAEGVLQAFRAGSFFADHGHIVREVAFTVAAPGLERPAYAGEVIEVPASAPLDVQLNCTVPLLDWQGRANHIDRIELIAVTEEGAQVVADRAPYVHGAFFYETMTVPSNGMVLRARGRRVVEDGPDLCFYTNPIRIVASGRGILSSPANFADWHRSAGTWLWLGVLAVGGVTLFSLLSTRTAEGRPDGGRLVMRQTHVQTAGHRAPLPPRRGHYGVLALLGILFVAYGSWVPFRLQSLEMEEAWRLYLGILTASGGRPGRVDFTSNLLLFIPISFCGMAALLTDRFRFRWTLPAVPAVLLVCTLASLTVEFGQLWVPTRVPSRFDVIAQLMGTGVGTILWLALGERFTAWLRQYPADSSPDHRLDWLLKTYLAALTIYHLIPFDLTIHPADLYHKFRDGHILLVPFTNRTLDGATLWELLFDVLVFVPVGLLCARWPVRSSGSLRSILAGTLFGVYLVAGIELCQLLVMSRFTESTDVLTGSLGVWLGVSVMVRWQLSDPALQGGAARKDHLPALTWWGIAGLYGAFLCVYFWWPLEPVAEGTAMADRLEGFFRLPFRSLERVSRLNAASQIVYKLMLFVPLGALLAKAVLVLPVSVGGRRAGWALVSLTVCGFALLIELGQAAFPPHIPDATDAALYTLGSLLGLIGVARWRGGER